MTATQAQRARYLLARGIAINDVAKRICVSRKAVALAQENLTDEELRQRIAAKRRTG